MGINLGDDGGDNGSSFFSSKGMMTDINITPFVDVILVLLIIFMVTAPFAISGVNVQLPSSKAKPLNLNGDPLVLSVTDRGEFFLGKVGVAPTELVATLKTARGSQREASLYIRADKKVPYGKVMEAMAAAQSAGIFKIGMMGEAASSSGKK